MRRADQAIQMAGKVVALARANRDDRSHAKAWFILSKSVAHALDYDLRILPPSELREPCTRLASAVRNAFDALRMLEGRGQHLQHFQAQLPVHYSGLGLRLPTHEAAAAAFWTATDLHATVLKTVSQGVGRPVQNLSDYDTLGSVQAQARQYMGKWVQHSTRAVAKYPLCGRNQ